MSRPLLERAPVMLSALALMVVLLLHACWRAPFYKIDDDRYVALSTRRPVGDLLRPTYGQHYVPVTLLSLRLDYVFFGAPRNAVAGDAPAKPEDDVLNAERDPFAREDFSWPSAQNETWAAAARLANGLYHLLAGVMLWMLLLRLGAGSGTAAFVALLWTGHPAALESVAWVCERKNVLAAFFGFATLLAWTAEPRRAWRWPAVYALYTLAVLSKPSTLGFLPVLAALEIFFSPGAPAQRPRFGPVALRLAIPTAVSAVAVYIAMTMLSGNMVEPLGGSVGTALLTDAEIFARYVGNIIAPVNLSFYYGVEPIVSLGDPRLWLYGAALAAFFTGLAWAAGPEHRRLALLGILWFFAALSTNSNLVATAFPMQDRYIYLSAPGLLLALACAARGLAARLPSGALTLRALAASHVTAIALLAAFRSGVFADSDRVELDAARRQPLSAFAQLNAARIIEENLHKHLPGGSAPDPGLAATFGRAYVRACEAVERCPDAMLFTELFALRTKRAEVLLALGYHQEARNVLNGWLPPPNKPLLRARNDDGSLTRYSRNEFYRGYSKRTLAHAWSLMAEAALRASAAPELSPPQRLALSRQALEEAGKSIDVHLRGHEAVVLKARILMRCADLLAAARDLEQARRDFDSAVVLLRGVPASSPMAGLAREILTRVPPPPGL